MVGADGGCISSGSSGDRLCLMRAWLSVTSRSASSELVQRARRSPPDPLSSSKLPPLELARMKQYEEFFWQQGPAQAAHPASSALDGRVTVASRFSSGPMLLEVILPPIIDGQSMQASVPGRDPGLIMLPHDPIADFIRVRDSSANGCTTVAIGPTVILGNLPPPCEEFQTPLIYKSKEEQFVGYEFIKALRISKLSIVSPLSPVSHHESLSNNEALAVHPKDKQSCD
jgi:hypothetical protein